MRGSARWCSASRIPLGASVRSGWQRDQLVHTAIEIGEPLVEQRAIHRRAAAIAFGQHLGQIRQRESDDQRALYQLHTRDRRRWIPAIAGRRAPRVRQQSETLVVAQRVGADARLAREVAGAEQSIAHFTRFETTVESPVL
jgi:hypothetical protein